MNWLYGNSWENFPIEPGQIWGLPNGSQVAVHNLFDTLPDWMKADMLFVDPPWNQGNLNSFYTKAGRKDYQDFDNFTEILFRRITEINPQTAYIEIGNQAVKIWAEHLKKLFSHVQHWPVVYYRKFPTNIIRGSQISPISYDFTNIDEAKCIDIIAGIENYKAIADPCMGRGLVGMAAYKAGKTFVGTELNKRRLAVLLEKLKKNGAEVFRIK